EPLVLLADPLTAGREWRAARPFLSPALRLVDLDLPTGGGRPGRTASELEDVLAEEIERRDQFPAHLLASSFAAAPALRLASRRPELVRSLLLHDPIVVLAASEARGSPAFGDVRNFFQGGASDLEAGDLTRAATSFTSAWGGDAQDAHEVLEAISSSDRSTAQWLTEYGSAASWEVRSHLMEEFLAPTLIVTGELSPALIRHVTGAVTTRLPNATEVQLPGATHFDPWRHPARFAGVVLTFCLERNVPVT
ncbi:MAG TPA: alpha/beta hydrolase, partial [Thermoplasmata archaeon]|nr:alpha/beta hydrolase [Thermoplasmata archaeon]